MLLGGRKWQMALCWASSSCFKVLFSLFAAKEDEILRQKAQKTKMGQIMIRGAYKDNQLYSKRN